jgi:hypothetical protein
MYSLQGNIKRYQLTARAHARLMKEINFGIMERQRDERVPKHFTIAAHRLYGARMRGAKYNEWKMKKAVKGPAPNVFTGRLEQSLRYQITATQYGSRLRISARLGKQMSARKWKKLTPQQQAKENRKRRRLAQWQKEEIAKVSREEIRAEVRLQAKLYKKGATGKYRRLRQRKIK